MIDLPKPPHEDVTILSTDMGWQLTLRGRAVPGAGCDIEIMHDRLALIDAANLDLPADLVSAFPDPPGAHCTASGLDEAAVGRVAQAILQAGANPNAGIPPGRVGWLQAHLWHGTDSASGENIATEGIDPARLEPGYFGRAFYAADDRALAASNYADAFDEDAGALVHLQLREGARVLDLRNPADSAAWAPHADQVSCADFRERMLRAGIDAVYDRSMGGIAVYNLQAVSVLGVEPPRPDEDLPEP